jgi:hypothetical protein
LSLKFKGKYNFLLKILNLLLQVRCYKQKRHMQGGHTQTKGCARAHIYAAGTAAAGANKGERAQTEGLRGRTSVNRHKLKAREVE